jgi:hypothetical protein
MSITSVGVEKVCLEVAVPLTLDAAVVEFVLFESSTT